MNSLHYKLFCPCCNHTQGIIIPVVNRENRNYHRCENCKTTSPIFSYTESVWVVKWYNADGTLSLRAHNHTGDTDPAYNPAEHWGEDFAVDVSDIEPEPCSSCDGEGYFPAHTFCLPEHAEPAYSCNECYGTGFDPMAYKPDEPEEIDLDLQGEEL